MLTPEMVQVSDGESVRVVPLSEWRKVRGCATVRAARAKENEREEREEDR